MFNMYVYMLYICGYMYIYIRVLYTLKLKYIILSVVLGQYY